MLRVKISVGYKDSLESWEGFAQAVVEHWLKSRAKFIEIPWKNLDCEAIADRSK